MSKSKIILTFTNKSQLKNIIREALEKEAGDLFGENDAIYITNAVFKELTQSSETRNCKKCSKSIDMKIDDYCEVCTECGVLYCEVCSKTKKFKIRECKVCSILYCGRCMKKHKC